MLRCYYFSISIKKGMSNQFDDLTTTASYNCLIEVDLVPIGDSCAEPERCPVWVNINLRSSLTHSLYCFRRWP